MEVERPAREAGKEARSGGGAKKCTECWESRGFDYLGKKGPPEKNGGWGQDVKFHGIYVWMSPLFCMLP